MFKIYWKLLWNEQIMERKDENNEVTKKHVKSGRNSIFSAVDITSIIVGVIVLLSVWGIVTLDVLSKRKRKRWWYYWGYNKWQY